MNIRQIFYTAGWILLTLVISMLMAIPVAMYYEENTISYFLYSALIVFVFSAICILQGLWQKERKDLKNKEGIATAGLTWILLCSFSALPYLISGVLPNLSSSAFEAFSALTATAASNIPDLETVPKSILFWRSLTQWLGGMGFIVLMVAILPLFGMGSIVLFKKEVPGVSYDKLKPRITETAKFLWKIYLFITIIFCLLLLLGGMNFFDSICHTFAMMATGGFSTKNESLAAYNSAYIEFVVGFFLFICSLNFTLFYLTIKGDFKALYKNVEVRAFFWVICIATFMVFVSLIINKTYDNALSAFRFSSFQVVSVISTTGATSTDWNTWPVFSQTVLFLLYFIGGTSCSTSGGIKIIRWIIMAKSAHRALLQAIHPKAVLQTRIGNKVIPNETVYSVWAVFIIFVFVLAGSTLALLAMGLDFATSLSSAASCLTNLGTPVTAMGATEAYSQMPGAAKYILSFCMLLGRLEYLTLFVLFIPSFWEN